MLVCGYHYRSNKWRKQSSKSQ